LIVDAELSGVLDRSMELPGRDIELPGRELLRAVPGLEPSLRAGVALRFEELAVDLEGE